MHKHEHAGAADTYSSHSRTTTMDAAAASAPKHSLAFILGGTNAAPTGWTINEVDAAAAAMTEMAARDHKLDVDVDVDRWSRPLPAPAPMAPRALMRLPSLGAIRSSIAPRTDRSMCDYSPEPRTAWVTMHAPTSRAVTHAKLPAHSSARNTRFKVASTISIGRTAREEHTRLVRADSLTPPLQQQSTPVAVQPTRASDGNVTHKRRPRAKNPMTAEEKRKVRACTVEGCSNYTIDRGLCFRHGGGKKCTMEGCSASAKSRGLCWKHGGSVSCTVEGCTRGAKSRGLCWSHGGGTKCSVPGCDKTTISKKLCWTHGGGKRCAFEGCMRPASTKEHNFCARHRDEVSEAGYVFEV